MSEHNDYQTFKLNVVKFGDRVDRIETSLVPGIFDINYCVEGTECWIELKSPQEPARPSTHLFASRHNFSQDQKNWAYRQMKAGGRCYLLIATDKRWMLLHGKYVEVVNELTVTQLRSISLIAFEKPVTDKKRWQQLRQILKQNPTATRKNA